MTDTTFITSAADTNRPPLKSLVFRFSSEHRKALRELCARTCVNQSVYLREAIADLLKKHGVGP